ncbi:MAG: N-acetylmuramoyl-L-alanine amidase [Candidatus Rhabdochlamydia sp.]
MTPLSSNINFENYPSPNYSERRGEGTPKILVMHYTACPTNESINTLTSKVAQVSAHYLIPTNGEKVYRLVEEDKRAWHAGVSYWKGVTDVNSYSIGIENVGWGYTYGPISEEPSDPSSRAAWIENIRKNRHLMEKEVLPLSKKTWHSFPSEQMNTLALLSKQIIERWSIAPENVVGHSDISDRKVDPGPLFDWEFFAKQNIGIWYDPNTDRIHSNKPPGISIPWMQQSLKNWGYKVPQNGSLDPKTKKVIAAFQMHFRPKNYDGIIDEESSNILDMLLCQLRNKLDEPFSNLN